MKNSMLAISLFLFILYAKQTISCKPNQILHAQKCFTKVSNCAVQTNKYCFKCDAGFKITAKKCVKDQKNGEFFEKNSDLLNPELYNTNFGFLRIQKLISKSFPTFALDNVAKVYTQKQKKFNYRVFFTLNGSDDVYEVEACSQLGLQPFQSGFYSIKKNNLDFKPFLAKTIPIESPVDKNIKSLESFKLLTMDQEIESMHFKKALKYILVAFPEFKSALIKEAYQYQSKKENRFRIVFNISGSNNIYGAQLFSFAEQEKYILQFIKSNDFLIFPKKQ